MNKSASTFKCLIHCLIYTASVVLCTKISPLWFVIVFASHFFIDRFSLADKWLYFYKARSLKDFLANGKKDIPMSDYGEDNYWVLRGGFTTIIYAVADNTMHLILMIIGAYYVGIRI